MAPKILSHDLLEEQKVAVSEALQLLAERQELRRLIWTCDICGMPHNDISTACESCGASGVFSQHMDTRPEMHTCF
ncbi:MAG: hypothetical protein IMW89_09620 [Ktedonobacteraceae bacterium]|nr:hypothetical protein [Ktedonobacteraceae bacterium]